MAAAGLMSHASSSKPPWIGTVELERLRVSTAGEVGTEIAACVGEVVRFRSSSVAAAESAPALTELPLAAVLRRPRRGLSVASGPELNS